MRPGRRRSPAAGRETSGGRSGRGWGRILGRYRSWCVLTSTRGEAAEDAVPGLVLWWWGYARVGDFGDAGVVRCTPSVVAVTTFLVAAAAPAATTTGAATAATAPRDPAAAADEPA